MDEFPAQSVVRRLQDGDPEAWRQIYDAYAERVWCGVARVLGPRPADVADIVQETLIAAARSARSYDPQKGSVWLWLWGIARNQVSLYYRKHQNENRWRELAVRLARSVVENPSTRLEAEELADSVRWALAKLPDEYERVLTWKYLDEESIETIALREMMTPIAISSRLARAREAFRALFPKMTEYCRNRQEVQSETL